MATTDGGERVDFVIVGAGAAGEAAAHLAAARGRSVAVIDDDLFGGSCAFWACIPSKALLHAAAVHHGGGDFPWERASDFRDYNIVREGTDYPSDESHVRSLREAGASVIRGRARVDGPGRVVVRTKAHGAGPGDPSDGPERNLRTEHIIIAVGSHSRIPALPGLAEAGFWTNREGTSTRELPRGMVALGGGPTGVELSQAFARYGVPVTIVDHTRLLSRDHPRTSELITQALERDGVTVRTGVRAVRVLPGGGADGAHRVELSDGSSADGEAILVAVGRESPIGDLGLETVGVTVRDGRLPAPDEQLRVADGVFVVGDPAGPELHTHIAHYEGELAVRIALGEEVRPDFSAIPRATYTDPETASVGLLLDEAREAGHADAFEETADLATTAKGYVMEASGHVTIVVDPHERRLLGAFLCGPGVSETVHEAVLAVKLRTPIATLADTIHAFPTVARVMGGLFAAVAKRLDEDR